MAKFKYIGDARVRPRILLDGGSVKDKKPARWADFGRSEIVEIKSPGQVKVMMESPLFKKEFILVPMGAEKTTIVKDDLLKLAKLGK